MDDKNITRKERKKNRIRNEGTIWVWAQERYYEMFVTFGDTHIQIAVAGRPRVFFYQETNSWKEIEEKGKRNTHRHTGDAKQFLKWYKEERR